METSQPSINIAPHSQTRVILMHAKAVHTLNDFYKDILHSFEIPTYFGNNLDALEEVLSDLSWINERHTIFIIYRSELLLAQYPLERNNLFEVLNAISNPALDILFL